MSIINNMSPRRHHALLLDMRMAECASLCLMSEGV